MPRLPRSLRGTLLSLILTFVALPQVAAQQPPPGLVEVSDGSRRGFWLNVGVGAGGESNDVFPGGGFSEHLYQPTFSFGAGGTIGQNLRVGGEVIAWVNEEADAVESLSSILLAARFYPLKAAGLYLKGGVGIGRNAVDFDDGFNVGDTGLAGLIGAGYEIRLGRRVYLNPTIDLVGHTYDGRAGADYRERLVNFGLGVLFQPGP
ncbi:MAG TPA: hypothetical protein VD930_09925 [Gemmatimonadales bacterium]|nr:hypothetical protein [Gemmatimonadales bacterium]